MNIIHTMNDLRILPRLVMPALEARLRVMPVVVVAGARQTGKSTLVRQLLKESREYFTLDDLDLASLAARNPTALLTAPRPITIDEVQRVPEFLHAVKQAVDEDRTPGRFLLTGSANLLLMRAVSESLAGRAAYLTLRPLTFGEQMGHADESVWPVLLASDPAHWRDILSASPKAPQDWTQLAQRGGFPTPALTLKDSAARDIWFDGYIRTYLERDLLDLSAVASLPDFRRLMRLTANRVGQTVNQSELGRSAGLSQPTVHRYLNLMETSYMLIRLPAYSVNRNKRLVKSPKYYWGDTGLAMHLSGASKPDGSHLENLILTDLLAYRDTGSSIDDVYHWRTAAGTEVDFVIESGDQLLPIEVKSFKTPRARDCQGIEAFLDEYPDSAGHGLLIHGGTDVRWLTPRVLGAPWWRVL